MRLRNSIFVCFGLLCISSSALAQAPVMAPAYKRCSTCHLPTGAGVKGIFPPLGPQVVELAQTPEGRTYLVLTVVYGVAGELVIGSATFRNFMPAQSGMTDGQIAEALNYVIIDLAKLKSPPKAFDEAEVAAVRAAHPKLKAQEVRALRPKLKS
jgi:mono/diheme cytochrome c family protein